MIEYDWKEIADLTWDKYQSDLSLVVHHILTEPTCPVVTVRFELPDRAGIDIITQVHSDTIEEGIKVAMENTMKWIGDNKCQSMKSFKN